MGARKISMASLVSYDACISLFYPLRSFGYIYIYIYTDLNKNAKLLHMH